MTVLILTIRICIYYTHLENNWSADAYFAFDRRIPLRSRPASDPADRMAGLHRRHRRHPGAQARAQRRYPRAQLPDTRDLPLRGRHRRRQPGARPQGDVG
ncbi:hypothetical protein MPLB_1640067 [Mesorhizobium sp. ORS 3324]|nr:hypothetical protein MPLB_1640067 [Mesorhizobium sp. ORS 3324]